MSEPELEYGVWGVPPGRTKERLVDTYEVEEWQFAQKLLQYLIDKGYTNVEVRLHILEGEDE
jgi:hypothetical protein